MFSIMNSDIPIQLPNVIIFGVERNYEKLYQAIRARYNTIAFSDYDSNKWHKTDPLSGNVNIVELDGKEVK